MRISPQQYFEEPQPTNNINYYPILLAVLIGGLIAITTLAIVYKK